MPNIVLKWFEIRQQIEGLWNVPSWVCSIATCGRAFSSVHLSNKSEENVISRLKAKE